MRLNPLPNLLLSQPLNRLEPQLKLPLNLLPNRQPLQQEHPQLLLAEVMQLCWLRPELMLLHTLQNLQQDLVVN